MEALDRIFPPTPTTTMPLPSPQPNPPLPPSPSMAPNEPPHREPVDLAAIRAQTEQRSTTTATAPSQLLSHSCRTSPSDKATLDSSVELDKPFDLNLYKQPVAFCRGKYSYAGLTTNKPEPLLRSTTSRSSKPPEAALPENAIERSTRKPVDLAEIRDQIRRSMAALDRLFPPMTPTTTTPLPQRQPDSPYPPPTLSPATLNPTLEREPFDLTANNSQLLKNMENMAQIYPSEPMPMTPLTTPQSDTDQSDTPPGPLETLPLLAILSRIGRFIDNTRTHNITLWKPDYLHRRPTFNRPIGHSQISVHHLAHETSNFPFLAARLHCPTTERIHDPLANLQYSTNNSTLNKYATSPYDPAFDIHPTRPDQCQTYYKNPTGRPSATPVQAFAHNKRPP